MAQTWWQRLFQIQDPPKRERVGRVISPRAIAGGRVSQDKEGDWLGANNLIVTPPPDYEDEWRLGNFDANTLSHVSPARLTEILSDLSPEVSRALWDFQRLFNPGWEAKAFRPGSSKAQYPRAQKLLDEFIQTLHRQHGTVDVLWGRLSMGAFWRGALLSELVLDRRGRVPLDIVAPDPVSVRFRKRQDADRGTVWELGQWQGGEWVSLDIPTVRYVPVDPAIGSPYGRPMISPAIFTAVFLLAMLHDLRRVIQQQGYPRLDIAIDLEKMAADNDDIYGDPAKMKEWADSIVSAVQEAYAQLEPDDAYVHSSTVSVNRPVGTVDASSLGAVDALIKALERMATRALKTMPLMMGLDQSTNETDSNRQWEIFAAGIKSIQHYAENMLEHLFTLALEAQGIQARVEFRFAELRAAEKLRDAQTEAMEIQNARAKYDNGWVSQDEAAEEVTGHKADQPAPRAQAVGAQFVQGDGDGQERAALTAEIRAARVAVAEALAHLEAA